MENKPKMDVNYFLEKLNKIPTNQWGSGNLNNHCVLWHCGMRDYAHPTEESKALTKVLFGEEWCDFKVWGLNDLTGKKFQSYNSPKERIIAALEEVKRKQFPNSIPLANELQKQELILN